MLFVKERRRAHYITHERLRLADGDVEQDAIVLAEHDHAVQAMLRMTGLALKRIKLLEMLSSRAKEDV